MVKLRCMRRVRCNEEENTKESSNNNKTQWSWRCCDYAILTSCSRMRESIAKRKTTIRDYNVRNTEGGKACFREQTILRWRGRRQAYFREQALLDSGKEADVRERMSQIIQLKEGDSIWKSRRGRGKNKREVTGGKESRRLILGLRQIHSIPISVKVYRSLATLKRSIFIKHLHSYWFKISVN